MVLLCVPDLLSKAPSLRLTDPLSPFGFHQQPPRLPAVLPRKRGCPPHLGPWGQAAARAAVAGVFRRPWPGLVGGTVPPRSNGDLQCRTSSSSPATSARPPKPAPPRAAPASPTSPWPPRAPAIRKAASCATRTAIGSRTPNGTASPASTASA